MTRAAGGDAGAADPPDGGGAEFGASPCAARRHLLLGALAAGVGAGLSGRALADDDTPANEERPQKGDLLVFSEGDNEGKVIKPDDLPVGGPPALAWPFDKAKKVARDGARLNQVLVLRLDPAELDDDTKARAANGIVAYSAVCAHAGCVVTAWVKDDSNTVNKDVLKCLCHNSEYDPRQGAEVVFGPAPRHLAALPLAMAGSDLTVAGGFVGKVGAQQAA